MSYFILGVLGMKYKELTHNGDIILILPSKLYKSKTAEQISMKFNIVVYTIICSTNLIAAFIGPI
jgi:hypothetical protein